MSEEPQSEQQTTNAQELVERIRHRFDEIEKLLAEMQARLNQEN